MDQIIAVSTIAHTIQLVMAPVFMVAGIAGLLNLLALRLNRIVDRARTLGENFTAPDHPDHVRQVWELRILDRRIRIVNRAILLCTASAIAICLVVAGLFIAALGDFNVGRLIAVAFILAMLLLIMGLTLFLLEIRLALFTIRVPIELLEREEENRRLFPDLFRK
jgi:uncharacterized membrane protein YciS (DUF1049 family)